MTEVKQLLSKRSQLREGILDELHGAGIEIVSPNFMNTRQIPEGKVFIPSAPAPAATDAEPEKALESGVANRGQVPRDAVAKGLARATVRVRGIFGFR